jgi:hypothetical protein
LAHAISGVAAALGGVEAEGGNDSVVAAEAVARVGSHILLVDNCGHVAASAVLLSGCGSGLSGIAREGIVDAASARILDLGAVEVLEARALRGEHGVDCGPNG